MTISGPENSPLQLSADSKLRPTEIVMGLNWDPPDGETPADPDDLDALCVLFDDQQRIIEVLHPAHPRNANSSVVHTGDSKTGSSQWDDERIFVFLEALPASVCALSFVVSSAKGRAFSEIHGASCHISDRSTENVWFHRELTTLNQCVACCVATLRRGATGWHLSTDAHILRRELLAELLNVVKDAKTRMDQPPTTATQ